MCGVFNLNNSIAKISQNILKIFISVCRLTVSVPHDILGIEPEPIFFSFLLTGIGAGNVVPGNFYDR